MITAAAEMKRLGFNSRSPSGLRHIITGSLTVNPKFQFTQPKRAATGEKIESLKMRMGFNSRSPSGLRPCI